MRPVALRSGEPVHSDGQSCSTSFRDQQVDDAGYGISGLIQTRCQTQDVIHRFRTERWLCANHPERTSADTDQYHHPGCAGLTGAAYDNMKTLMNGRETHLHGAEAADLAAVLAVHPPVRRRIQLPHHGMCEAATHLTSRSTNIFVFLCAQGL